MSEKISDKGKKTIYDYFIEIGVLKITKQVRAERICTCSDQQLYLHGCICGAMEIEKDNKEINKEGK